MSGEYSLSDVLERIFHNQLALEAAMMELTLQVERQGLVETGENVRGALQTIGENSVYVSTYANCAVVFRTLSANSPCLRGFTCISDACINA